MKEKICSTCNQKKDISEFYFRKRRSTYESPCKECAREVARRWRKENKERSVQQRKEYYRKNKEVLLEKYKEYYQGNKEAINKKNREYAIKNKEEISEYQKKWRTENGERKKQTDKRWRENNRAKRREHQRNYNKRRRATPKGKLDGAMSIAIYRALNGAKNGYAWKNMVKYTITDLMKHLESHFRDGMNWDNYGKGGWEVDHIKPLSSFDYNSHKQDQFRECWALENLQPLWWWENSQKFNKLDRSPQDNGIRFEPIKDTT